MTSDEMTVLLSDGTRMPAIGLGTWRLDDHAARESVVNALARGYRLIDTASRYENERGVGEAIAASEVPRGDITVVTKLRGSQQGYDTTLAGFEESRSRLGLDYVDEYLIHWPLPARNLYIDSWRAMIRLREEGLVRSIGVSNFTEQQIARLAAETGEWPAVNQVEIHPSFQQSKLRAYHTDHGIVAQASRPLGGSSEALHDPTLLDISRSCGRSVAQVVLRWHVQSGTVPLPHPSNASQAAENINVFSFTLTEDDMARIARLDAGNRVGGDPDLHEEF
jgi:2,5-diketo-D-gluconate reductase A